jgi:D-alanyl-D-alanine carboxypeptidase
MMKVKGLFRLGAVASLLAAVFAASRAEATPSLVIDVASGQVLSQDQATASWYPASLTKLMTVYVALDAVRAGRLTLDTPLMMSPRACRMAPSKMGFRPGTEVTLKNALVMLMVKSANDIAVAIAEGVSGSVEAFADEMNQASARLGMTQSQWVNPNGLPDERQVTSARDLAILGRALYTQFPEYAYLFNIGAMQLGGRVHPTHNGLLGRYPGADGMKTGFTCPAGFNLVASATHGGQRLIAVVLGAPSAGARTAKAASILDRAFQTASPIGPLSSLPSSGPTAAPDMRDSVCRHRGAATAEFMAEVEDSSIPLGSSTATGIPLLDSMGAAGQPRISVKEIARLPRPRFEPVAVYVGRAPGYVGPVARARAPGAPVGEQPDLAAYAEPEPAAAGASPIGRAAPDAASLRKGKRAKKGAPAVATAPVESIVQDDNAAPEAKTGAKTDAKPTAKPAAKARPAKPIAKPAAKAAPAAPKAAAAQAPAKAGAKPAPKPAATKAATPVAKAQPAGKPSKTQ